MVMRKFSIRIAVVAIACLFLTAQVGAQTPQLAPVNPAFERWQAEGGAKAMETAGGHPLGYIPPPVDWSFLKPVDEAGPKAAPPASYDLRTLNALTAVRDQGQCGCCWDLWDVFVARKLAPNERRHPRLLRESPQELQWVLGRRLRRRQCRHEHRVSCPVERPCLRGGRPVSSLRQPALARRPAAEIRPDRRANCRSRPDQKPRHELRRAVHLLLCR